MWRGVGFCTVVHVGGERFDGGLTVVLREELTFMKGEKKQKVSLWVCGRRLCRRQQRRRHNRKPVLRPSWLDFTDVAECAVEA